MITYAEVKQSPTGWEDTKMSFESDLTALVDSYRNKINKHYVSKALTAAGEVAEKDEGWLYDEANIEPEEGEPATLVSLTPNTAEVGSADVTMTATGTGFDADSVIVFNAGEEATTFVSDTELTTIVSPATASGAGDVPVLVRTAAGDTAPLNFTFTAPAGG